jgi:hypothetical protein
MPATYMHATIKRWGYANPFQSNGLVNMPTTEYYWKWCFLLGPCKVVIRKTIRAIQSVEGWLLRRALYGRL